VSGLGQRLMLKTPLLITVDLFDGSTGFTSMRGSVMLLLLEQTFSLDLARLVPQTPPLNSGQRADNQTTGELIMENREFRRSHVAVGALWIAASMTVMACSKGDTVNNGNTQPVTPVTSCGTLLAADAAQFFSTRLEHFGSVGLATLAGLENSRAAARVLSFGYNHVIDPFVADDQANLHDSLGDFRDDYLIAANVESATDSSVTFLLNPETQCEDSGPVAMTGTGGALGAGGAFGTGGTLGTGGSSVITVDPNCVAEKKAHPTRVRISRIDCSNGDNVAIEFLYGPQSARVVLAELYAERAELELDLGAFLTNSYSVTISGPSISGSPSTQTRTEKPIVSSAVGVLHGSMTLTSSNQGNGRISVTNAIDFTTADDEPTQFQFPAGTDIAIINADGATKTIQVDAKTGAFDSTVTFSNFLATFFNLSTTTAASTQPAVALHMPPASGSIKLDGVADRVTLDGVDLAGASATATQAGKTLLAFTAAGASQSAVSAVFTGNSDDSLGVACADGLAVEIRYGLEPVMSLIQGPANYIASDTLSVRAPAGSNVTLWKELASDDLAVSSSGTGELLRVDAGSLSLQSALWPSDSVTTTSNQCLTCNVVTQTGHNDLLDDYTVGACTQ